MLALPFSCWVAGHFRDRPVLLSHSSVDGHLGGSHLLAVMKNADMDVCEQVLAQTPVFMSLGWTPRGGVAASCSAF